MKNIQLLITCLLLSVKLLAQNDSPSDQKATKETVNLFRNLKKVVAKGKYMFGHQDELAYGVNWKYQPGRSDVKDVTGDYPAVYGWELGHLEIDAPVNLDSVPFDKMRGFIQQAYQRGGVITISWHGRNPMNGNTAWDPAEGTVTSILPDGEKHDVFKAQLDKIAHFLSSLKGRKGEAIPVLFRPFHEHTGGWFWWGSKTTNAEEYKKLFRFTVDYLKNEKKLHNLLYVYNTGSEFNSAETFLERYPGDDVVDVVSFDTYQRGNADGDTTFQAQTNQLLSIIEKVAEKRNKVAVLGETGYNQIPYAKWWTKTLLPALSGRKIAYVLVWRNAGYKGKEKEVEFYAPYKGHTSAADFIQFYKRPETMFQKEVSYKSMYQK